MLIKSLEIKLLWHTVLYGTLMGTALVSCTPPPLISKEPDYRRAEFFLNQIADQAVTVFPLCTPFGLDTSEQFDAKAQARFLSRVRPDMEISLHHPFVASLKGTFGPTFVDSFLNSLSQGKIAWLQTHDSAWSLMPTEFALVARIAHGHKIKAFSGSTKHRVTLELELWEPRLPEVSWRCTIIAEHLGNSLTDVDFIKSALEHAYKEFPPYQPGLNEKNW